MAFEDYDGIWRYVVVIVSMTELLWFSGIMYGWGALVYVLKEEGFLEELCRMSNGTIGKNETVADCSMRDARFNLYFTLISSIGLLLVLPIGHIFTRFGTRTTRLIFITSLSSGCLFVAFADTEYPWFVCIGGILMIGSGYVFIITSTQFNRLFPGHSSTIVGMISGMKVSSSFMQQLVKMAHANGISRRTSYLILFGLALSTFLSTIFLYPKHRLKEEDNNENLNINTHETRCSNELTVNNVSKNNKILCQPSGDGAMFEEITVHSDSNSCYNGSDFVSIIDRKCNNMTSTVHEETAHLGEGSRRFNDVVMNKSEQIEYISNGKIECNGKCNVSDINVCCMNECELFESGDFVNEISPGNGCDINKEKRDINTLDVANDYGISTQLSHETIDDRLKTHMCSYLYLLQVFWFFGSKFRLNFFVGTINPFIEEVTRNNDEKVSYYTDILSYSMASGLVTCTLVGILCDWQRRFFKDIQDVKRRRMLSSVSPLIATCLVSVVLSSLMFVEEEMILYPITITITLFRSLLTTSANNFLVDMFPASIYGTLYGTQFIVANVLSLIQYGLYEWSLAYSNAGLHVNLCVLGLCLTTVIHPVVIMLTSIHVKATHVKDR